MTRLGGALRLILATLLDAGALYRLAPVLPLIAVVAELAQHAAEMKLGMFASREDFRALGQAPVRMSFGYVKVAAVVIVMLLSARFWARRVAVLSGGTPGLAWRPLLTGLAIMVALSLATAPGLLPLSSTAYLILAAGLQIASLPVATLVIAGLLGRDGETLGRVYRDGWGKGLRIVALTLVTIAPLMVVHYLNHTLALGRSPALQWSIMVWDAVLVGWMGAVLGTALHHGYFGTRTPPLA